MKKKILLIEIISSLLALVSVFIISTIIVNNQNYKKAEQDLNTYLNIACEIFDGDNFNEVDKVLHESNNDIRITIIEDDGDVIVDSLLNSADNHLDREELKNLDKIVVRYSSSLGCDMMYLARMDEGYYVRLAVPLESIESFVNRYICYGAVTIVVILATSILVTLLLFDRTLKPIKKEINKLEQILGNEVSNETNFEHLSNKINELTNLLNNKVTSLYNEKEKSKYILDNMNQGLILLNKKGKIKLINKFSLRIFGFDNDYLIDKNYLYLFRDLTVQEKIKDCLEKQIENQVLFELDAKKYLLYINLLDEKWLSDEEIISLLIVDVTLQEEINSLKRDFFANASHELKSPLTSIIGYQQLIQQGILESKEEIQDATERTIKEAHRMNKLIIEMLDLSRLENNVQTLIEEVDLNKIIFECLLELKVNIEKKNIEIVNKSSKLVFNGSQSDVYKLIKNILENAIIYNIDNGTIEIIVNSLKKTITIKDTGVGIAKADLEHIFDRFYRVDKARSRTSSGTGLGLSIVKHICLLYGYHIDIRSKLGKGTKVTISFN